MTLIDIRRKSTDELKGIVKALSKLRLLNTPEEDQRLFDAENELRRRKKEDEFINAHFQVIVYNQWTLNKVAHGDYTSPQYPL